MSENGEIPSTAVAGLDFLRLVVEDFGSDLVRLAMIINLSFSYGRLLLVFFCQYGLWSIKSGIFQSWSERERSVKSGNVAHKYSIETKPNPTSVFLPKLIGK
jgi:hypothetical protein